MKSHIEQRAVTIAKYILEKQSTVRQTAKVFGVSKSTVHKDVTERLEEIQPTLASEVKQILEKNQRVQVYVGAGGEDGSGGTSYYGNLYAQGGTSTRSNGIGGDGGSGGGGGERGSDPYNPSGTAGRGGSDGGNGEDLSSYSYGGRGQGRTTREFGEPEGALYSGGGGGRDLYGGAPGGEGTPVIAAHGASAGSLRGGGPGGGYGGGGGGSSSAKSKGAQGIVIIRDAR